MSDSIGNIRPTRPGYPLSPIHPVKKDDATNERRQKDPGHQRKKNDDDDDRPKPLIDERV